jgi:hypothetical protein
MLTVGRLFVVILVCHASAPLYAQTVVSNSVGGNRRFIDIALGPNWDDARNSGVPGATWGSGIAVGFDSGHLGAEFDVHVPQWHVQTYPPWRFQYMGRSFGYEQQGHFYESAETTRRRSIDVVALYRANMLVNRHVTVTGLVGGGFIYRPEHYARVTTELLPDGSRTEVDRYANTSWRNYLAAAARLDVECRISQRVFVVPRLRVTAFPSFIDDSGLAPRVLAARPEIGVRWDF